MKRLALLLILPLAGCDLASLEGKPSEFQKYQNRLALVETRLDGLEQPVVQEAAVVAVVAPEPVVEPVLTPEPEPEPVCVAIFRVRDCP